MEQTLKIPSVTGVDVELRLAGPGGRSYAFIIDWHIRALAAVAWLVVAGAVAVASGTGPAGLAYGVYLPAAGFYFLYHPVLEVLMHGRTPGKRIAGIRLLRTDGGVPGAGALLIRNVFRLIDSLPGFYCVGLGVTMLTRNAQRIGDLAAGTLLVYEEPETAGVSVGMSGRAVERLGLQQAEIVRDLLQRWKELEPEARRALARKLLDKARMVPATDDDESLRSALQATLR